MSIYRSALLIAGPFVLVTGFYFLTFSGVQEGRASSNAVHLGTPETYSSAPQIKTTDPEKLFQAECETRAKQVQEKISIPINTLVRAPYILMGDYDTQTLDALYRKTILPTQYALNVWYFDRKPDRPITIIALSSQDRYQQVAFDLDRRKVGSYYGYFHSEEMRIILNLTTGSGTLAHELTHALAEIDFPNMPEWFDEGLASLHEQCEFSESENQLLGSSNWRVQILLSALDRGQLPTLKSLVQQIRIGKEREALTYAHARYFSLYLQEKRLLSPFYRKLRTNAELDQSGLQTLQQVLNVSDLSEMDPDFQKWLIGFRTESDK
ncbi:hypothetical protein [Gimesia aquarii]|uniref:DUF1570 domain-containing protein n=1 Tax=Gimesia aquarii TaxID=2527964 RepID=A0A517WVK3_9PLAN|nr:hypothetical protein [Gimesia aquarii]QDU09274.1 hypothetical protein V202x_26470 [Gimesia aquarii]